MAFQMSEVCKYNVTIVTWKLLECWLHILWQTFQKFLCDNCDNVFTNFTHLKVHVKILLIDRENTKKMQPVL